MIVASNVSFAYPNHVHALRELSFRLEDGKKYALVGANGAGKSTLLSILCGLEMPQSGSVAVDGTPLDKEHVHHIRENVAMVFQNPDDQLFMPTVYEDIAFGLRNRGIPEEQVKARVNEVMERMEIAHLRDRPPYRLSGGEKRSAAISTVLIMQPHMILMDEPTAFLDPRARRNFIRLMHSLQIGMLVATHDLDLARNDMDGVLIMREGSIFAQGPASLLEDEQLLKESFLL